MEPHSLIPGEPLSIQVDYLYPVQYAKRSWVNNRKALFRASTTISIKTALIEDMPVAFKVRQANRYGGRDRLSNPYDSETPVEIRFHRNRFYAEWSDLDSFLKEVREGDRRKTTPLRDLKSDRERWVAKDKSGREYEAGHEIHDERSLRQMVDAIWTFEDDGGKKVAENALADAGELIAADGRIFFCVAEPALRVGYDLSIEPAHDGTRHQSFLRSAYSVDDRYLPLTAVGEVEPERFAEDDVYVEVLRPDLVFADRDDGQVMALAEKLMESMATHMSEMPLEWAVASASLRDALHARPRHMTFEVAQALQDVAELALPSNAEVARLVAEAGPRDFGNYIGTTPENALKELPKFKVKADELARNAWPLLQEGVLRDRGDSHHVSAAQLEGFHRFARARQARSREDVRRVAQMADLSFEDLWDRLRDDRLDLVLVELDYCPVRAGREGHLRMAAVVDRFAGTEVERFASPEEPEKRPSIEALLYSHVAGLAPGHDPEPATGRPTP